MRKGSTLAWRRWEASTIRASSALSWSCWPWRSVSWVAMDWRRVRASRARASRVWGRACLGWPSSLAAERCSCWAWSSMRLREVATSATGRRIFCSIYRVRSYEYSRVSLGSSYLSRVFEALALKIDENRRISPIVTLQHRVGCLLQHTTVGGSGARGPGCLFEHTTVGGSGAQAPAGPGAGVGDLDPHGGQPVAQPVGGGEVAGRPGPPPPGDHGPGPGGAPPGAPGG